MNAQAQWQTFASDYSKLEQAFDSARAYFNKPNWDGVEGLLDQNVVLKKVRHSDPDELVRGRAKVMNYLRQEVKDHPQFNPHTKHIDLNLGSVSGTADWKDDNGRDTIRYFFLFAKQGDRWLLLFLWGSEAL